MGDGAMAGAAGQRQVANYQAGNISWKSA